MRRATLSAPPVFALVERARGRVTLAADTGAFAHLFVLEEDMIRLLLLPTGRIEGPPSWAIAPGGTDIDEPGRDRMSATGFSCPDFAVVEPGDGTLRIETGRIRFEVVLAGFRSVWSQRDGDGWRLMAADRPTQAYDFGWWNGRVAHYVARRQGERFYGLGERAGPMDRAGGRFRLVAMDPMGYDAERSDPLYKAIPYLLIADPEGACHGAFYDTTADVTFDLGREIDNYHGPYRSMVAESGDLDLTMIAGPDPAVVTRRFTWLTGRPALMPRWSLGYSGSTMSYTDAPDAEARMAGFIEKLAMHDIGCSSFHLSSGYSSIGARRYVFHWNHDKFPDPARFIAAYRAAGIEIVPNVKPVLLRDHPRYAELAAARFFVTDEQGAALEAQFWDELGSFIDFTKPDAAGWWRAQVASTLLAHGIASSWNDNNEYGIWDAQARFDFFGEPRPAAEGRPVQALLMSRASRASQLAHAPDRRPYVVTRSGMAGLQRYAQTWSGDNRTDWATIRFNAKMGLGLALSGVSNNGHDVGGFSGPPPSPELLVRWIQAGILMPRFSIHSWNDDGRASEPWMYPEMLPAIRKLMLLRQTLIPFLYDLLWRHHRDYEPVIRPTWLEFPADPGAWTDGDEHLLGHDLLVALVVDAGATMRRVRPPAGADWIDVWTGALHRGGEWAELAAPLDGPPPLLARAGSAVLVDLARGGFRPEPLRRGVWLFPPPGEADFDWEALDDDGDGFAEPDLWSASVRCSRDRIEVLVTRRRGGCSGPRELTIVPLPGDTRSLIVTGGSVRGNTVTL